MLNLRIRAAILIFIVFTTTNVAFSQANVKIDSLTMLLNKHPQDDTVKTKILIRLSTELNKIFSRKEAIAYTNKALMILENYNAPELKADALKVKAKSLYGENRTDEAIEIAEKNLVLCEHLNNTQKIIEAQNLLGNFYDKKSDYGNAQKYYNKSFVLCEKIDDIKLKITIWDGLAHAYHHLTDYKNQISCLEKLLEIFQKSNEKQEISSILCDIGFAYMLLGYNVKAIEALQEALRIDEALKDIRSLAYDYKNLAGVYRNLLDYDKALEYYKIAINFAIKADDKGLEGHIYGRLAFLYSDMKRHEEAISAITKCIETHKEMGNDENKLQGWINLGDTYSKAGRNIEAYSFYQKGLNTSRRTDSRLEIASCLIGMGFIYAKEPDPVLAKMGINPVERYSKMELFATEALEISTKSNSREQAKTALELLSIAYEGNKNYIKAYETYKQYIAIKDSTSGDDVKKQITRKEIQYEFDKKETELKYQQQLTAEQLEQQKLLTVQREQALTLNQQTLTLKEQALALSNKEKDLAHLAYLKEQAEKQEKEQQLSLSQEREKGKERDLTLKNLELSAQQKQNLYLGLLVASLLGGLGVLAYFYSTLKKQKNIIAQQNELNEQTITILSHDIKEPLLGVKLLLKKLNKDDPFVAQASQSLEGQINAVNGILTNLLKMKKLSLAKTDKNATTNAKTVVNNVIRELNGTIQSKTLTIHNELSDEVMLPIAAEKLQIIVHNLLSNAVKYSFSNQQIRIFKEGKGICIQDFGIGLAPEQRTKLMREVTASERGTDQERGNGLGLFLVGAMLQGEQLKVVFDSPEVGGTIAKVMG